MQLSYAYGDTSYDSDDFRDYLGHNLRSAWLHELKDEKTTLGLLVGATRVEFGDNVDNPNEDRTDNTIRAGVQVDHWFSETFIVNLKAGVRHTKSDIDGGDNNTDTGFVGDLAARWISERSSLSARVNQQRCTQRCRAECEPHPCESGPGISIHREVQGQPEC